MEDFNQEWTFGESCADYIHLRRLAGSVTDWTALFKQAYRYLKPGGYVESHEASPRIMSNYGSIHQNTALGQWHMVLVKGGAKLGKPFTVVEDDTQREAMEAAGFVDVKVSSRKCPIGDWPEDKRLKTVGSCLRLATEQDAEGTFLRMARALGWNEAQVKAYACQLKRELRSEEIRPYIWQTIVWGRKP
ncbi:hypothetical protein NW757_011110 [Fusarium falciforme]|nr:hypothetical protein NW757_011110 [Fusarium falciforme]